MKQNHKNKYEQYKAIIEKDTSIGYTDIVWRDITFKLKKTLTLSEMRGFVESVIGVCIGAEDIGYTPELRGFIVRLAILNYYTDFDIPKDVSEKYSLVYETDLVSVVLEQIDTTQYQDIMRGIDEKLDYLAKIKIADISSRSSEVMSKIEELADKMSKAYSSLNNELVAKLVDRFANGDFNEDRVKEIAGEVVKEANRPQIKDVKKDEPSE